MRVWLPYADGDDWPSSLVEVELHVLSYLKPAAEVLDQVVRRGALDPAGVGR